MVIFNFWFYFRFNLADAVNRLFKQDIFDILNYKIRDQTQNW